MPVQSSEKDDICEDVVGVLRIEELSETQKVRVKGKISDVRFHFPAAVIFQATQERRENRTEIH
jgi:hypothetical protein